LAKGHTTQHLVKTLTHLCRRTKTITFGRKIHYHANSEQHKPDI